MGRSVDVQGRIVGPKIYECEGKLCSAKEKIVKTMGWGF